MNKKIYLVRMNYVRYDENHYLLYLNEKRVENYQPDASMCECESESGGDTVTAYSYEGSEPDGSIKIEATSASYNDFVAGLVRTKYSQNDVEAILCNHGDGDSGHDAEFLAFQEWRDKAKEIAQEVLKRAIA